MPNTIRPSNSIRALPRRITIAVWPIVKKDNLEQALIDYTQAIRLDPKYIPAYANRGYAFYKLGDLDRALADFEKVLELDPNNADAKKSKEVIVNMRIGSELPRN